MSTLVSFEHKAAFIEHSREDLVESVDFEISDSELERREYGHISVWQHGIKYVSIWLVVTAIAVLTACFAIALFVVCLRVDQLRRSLLAQYIGNRDDVAMFLLPLLLFVSFNFLLASLAAMLIILIEPAAGGSGLADVICYLNQVKLPHMLRLKTLVVKLVALILTSSSFLYAGKEEPLIHVGAIVGAGVSQGNMVAFGWDIGLLHHFRNDHDKSKYIATGAAAGIAAAFGTPIAAALFVIELGSAVWTRGLQWRALVAAFTASVLVSVFLSGVTLGTWGSVTPSYLLNFGAFSGPMPYPIIQFPLFFLLGIAGGLLGAIFNALNLGMNRWRYKRVRGNLAKVTETAVVILCSSVLAFSLPYFMLNCRELAATDNAADFPLYYCPQGSYNELSLLIASPPQDAVRQLLHADKPFVPRNLGIALGIYTILGAITYGMHLPTGVILPCLAIGSIGGRLFGQFMVDIFPSAQVTPGLFALVGAASMFAGVSRAALFATVLVLELSGELQYGVPLVMAVLAAKITGDLLNGSAFQNAMVIRKIPVLDVAVRAHMKTYRACDVMSSPVVSLSPWEQVDSVITKLQTCEHNGFPVVHEGVVVGLIRRAQLVTLLRKRAFVVGRQKREREPLKLTDFAETYPRHPAIEKVAATLSPDDRRKSVALGMYMNLSPLRVQQTTPLYRVYKLFQIMGLRHLVVVDRSNQLVGIITRQDLFLLQSKQRAVRINER